MVEIQTSKTAPAKPWSILLYGLPKSGKTVFACKAPEPFLIESDIDGEISLRNHPELSDVPYTLAPTFKQVVEVLQWLKKEKPPYKTIIIDTLSGLQESQRLDEIGGNPLTDSGWKFNEHVFTKNNFKLNTLVKDFLELKKACGYNIIFCVHLKEEKVGSSDNSRILLRPDLSPSLLKAVAAHVNAFFALSVEGANERQLVVEGNKLLMAASRYKFPKTTYKNPSFDDIRKVLEA